jgi:hypothetical protein
VARGAREKSTLKTLTQNWTTYKELIMRSLSCIRLALTRLVLTLVALTTPASNFASALAPQDPKQQTVPQDQTRLDISRYIWEVHVAKDGVGILIKDPDASAPETLYLVFAYHLIRHPSYGPTSITPSDVATKLTLQRTDIGAPRPTIVDTKKHLGESMAYNLFSDLAIVPLTIAKVDRNSLPAASLLTGNARPYLAIAVGRPQPLYGEGTRAFLTPFETTTAVANYLNRQLLPDLFVTGHPPLPDGTIIQLSLAAVRPGYSGGPIFTQDQNTPSVEPKVLGVVFAATQDKTQGLGASADDIIRGIKALKAGKPENKDGWNVVSMKSENALPRDHIVDPLPGVFRAGTTIVGDPYAGTNKSVKQGEAYAAFSKIAVLADAAVYNVTFDSVTMKRAPGEYVELGKSVRFVRCDVTNLRIDGGDASLLTFDHCIFDAKFLNNNLKPTLGYGVEFIVDPDGPQARIVREYWRDGNMTNYTELEILVAERTDPKKFQRALVCKGNLVARQSP